MVRLKHDEPGQRIAGKYQLLEVAGNGGMALVWRAVVDMRGTPRTVVAIKRLLPELNHSPPHVSMFEEEGRVGLKLRHPDIVDTLDFGREPDGRLYLVMEWVDGLDLRRILVHYRKSGRSLGWPVVAHMGRKLLSALSAAHEYVEPGGRAIPIFHRDVSPQNVMVAEGGAIKLSDFGLARAMDRGSMTNPNIIKGKLSYMAPEQVIGRPATAQTDIFSVGVMLWEALVGRKLFRGESDMDLVMAVRNAVVPPLRDLRPDTPEPLALAIERALAKDPRKRFPTAAEMGRAIEAALDFRNQRVAPTTVGRIVDEVKKARAAQRQAEFVPFDDGGPPIPEEPIAEAGGPILSGESWPEVIATPAPQPEPPMARTPSMGRLPAVAGSPSYVSGSIGDEPEADSSLTDDAGEASGYDDPVTLPGTAVPPELRALDRLDRLGKLDRAEPDLGDDGGFDERTLAEDLNQLAGHEGPSGATEVPAGTEPPTLGGTGYPTIPGIVERRDPGEPRPTADPDATPGPRRPLRGR